MVVLIFGDSITQGYWDQKGGWADRIKASVFEKDIDNDFKRYHGVHNLGIDGNTTAQVLERFNTESKARFWPGAEYAVVFAVGVNDTVISKDSDTLSSPEQYKRELASLLQRAQAFTSNIMFVNICPVDETLTNPLPASSTGKCYTNDRIDSFNKVLRKFTEENNVSLVDVASLFRSRNDLLADGLHPNTAGHEVIFNAVQGALSDWLYAGNK